MPETYTKEQTEEAKAQARFYVINGHLIPNECGAILLSALESAERERGALKARCAELEGSLRGAADQEQDNDHDAGAWWWVQKIRARNPNHRNSWSWSNKSAAKQLDDYFKELVSTGAIVGKKEG